MSTSSFWSFHRSGMANGFTHLPAPAVAAIAAAFAEMGTLAKPRTRPKKVPTAARRTITRTFSLSGMTTTTASFIWVTDRVPFTVVAAPRVSMKVPPT